VLLIMAATAVPHEYPPHPHSRATGRDGAARNQQRLSRAPGGAPFPGFYRRSVLPRRTPCASRSPPSSTA
jgi:hypothetical protein